MIWLAAVGLCILVCFSFVLLVGAPYVPTLSPQVKAALDLIDLQPNDTLLELGCGDGKVLIAAAQAGLRVIGYELNPILAAVAWARTRRFHGHVKVICADFWRTNWPPADAIFTFLLPRYMTKLDKKIIQFSHKPVKLVSFAFQIPNKIPSKQKSDVYLYRYQ